MTNLLSPLRAASLASAAALTFGVAACGGGDHAGHDSGSGASTPAASSTATGAAGSSPATSTPAAGNAIDAAFIRQMIPHHQGAVEMARVAERDSGRDEIKTLAGQIIEDQERELKELDGLATELGVDLAEPETKMAADAKTLGLSMDEMGMSMDHSAMAQADDVDLAFLDMMLPHHEGAIAMAQAQFKGGDSLLVRELADEIISAQQREILQMTEWRTEWFPDAPAADAAGHGGHEGHGG